MTIEKEITQAVNDLHINSLAVEKKFDLTVYDRNAVEEKIRFYMGQSIESLLNSGKLLVQLKENEPHGSWIESLNRIGLDRKVAARMMQAATKFSNVALTRHLTEAAGNKTKLFELLILDDEEIEELSTGGTVANIQLDDIARMSTTELRAALRKTKEEAAASLKAKDGVIEAKAKELEAKNKSIDKLTEQLGHKKHGEEQGKEIELPETPLLRNLNDRVQEITNKINTSFLSDINALYKIYPDNTPRYIELQIAQKIGLIIATTRELANDLGIQPIEEVEQATDDPAKLNAEAMLKWNQEQERLSDDMPAIIKWDAMGIAARKALIQAAGFSELNQNRLAEQSGGEVSTKSAWHDLKPLLESNDSVVIDQPITTHWSEE